MADSVTGQGGTVHILATLFFSRDFQGFQGGPWWAMVGISKGTVFAAAERACLVVMHANKEARESISRGESQVQILLS